ncbi:MAG: bifunctional alpha,alpha-trehalose-phosphate synthase (UDP-forming)/trehalose-phosphatase [Sphingobacteriales bacterium 17-39-43]|uniref:bifunctional alpha,alpha-trehalose-phosphate synthase (UDP-forming)/trehalose-phosphatase n=1 Tax=Daejeonella sp. TaxID=2805397 RepID=UPI000BD2D767|nr:bifunctional alpha,alpha-trehalose-phosphate synthase (UDP-forming)/trehalose-phosphatase [Daejeonella sp.]OYZ30490.1 MAG: bifunctional alpha,alpha-trehalose-phosphate synthase (UDP-forming)/trehalose-phosphatase [Sphingobacteriales bacterium 16-39-50]OZA23137.1 MAG: bifunctional alpha,alpha-trehalose-phosphate synthase (UDP-forming)/trehalose-phosphatase [Sphingobacteriales bacterium 17-39-43]HQT24711.1 bifunctional alpha,alpha-trehalose-phosphate synthase (UDP-forming)/trehalose-phosphatase
MSKTIIVSNRLPVKISDENGEYTYSSSEGGLATGLGSIYKDGENIWIGWPGIEVNESGKKADITRNLKDMKLLPVFLSQEEISEYYEGFSNEILWPIFHYYASTYVNYKQSNWDFYQSVNQKFRDAILDVAEPGDTIWIHDYQLLLLPGMVRSKNVDLTIGFFLHIPFPSYELFRLIPWRAELLEGMLGADLVGFHTYDDVQHFMNAAIRILPINSNSNILTVDDRPVVAEAFPMGIDYNKYSSLTNDNAVLEQIELLKENFSDSRIILSVDRLDYSKGILQRLAAFELLLELYPEYIGKVVLYMVVVPSRDTVPQYKELKDHIDKKVGNINASYRTMQWSPVLYFYRSLSIEELSALYQIADIGLVTPMRDGMNLVSKEYVASRTGNNGVLILSEMAGASKELIDALIVNPNNIGDITRAIVQALNMTLAEQETKMAEMRKVVSQFNIFHWVRIYMDKLQEVKELQRSLQSRHVDQRIAKTIITRYSTTSKRIIFLDYDGTLVNFNTDINKASPDSGLYQLLAKLSSDKANEIVLISGRDHHKMDEWFGNSGVHIIAEHGVWQKEVGGKWTSIMGLTDSWKEEIFPILNTYVERTPGSFIEEKSFSLVWHFRKVPKDLGDLRVSELVNNLVYLTKDKGLQLLPGNKVIEIKNIEINKGKAALNFMFKKDYDFIMAIGDDHTDEDIFKALPDSAYTFKVGSSLSAARFYLRNSGDVRQFLHRLSSE